jgi:hypothetical protein
MRVRVSHTLDDLERALVRGAARARPDCRDAMKDAVQTGNYIAKQNAKRTAGRHGKHYPKAFSWEVNASLFGGAGVIGIYGPEVGPRQGRMSFEEGSRNQPPHNDLEKTRNHAAGLLAQNVRAKMDNWFWL